MASGHLIAVFFVVLVILCVVQLIFNVYPLNYIYM